MKSTKNRIICFLCVISFCCYLAFPVGAFNLVQAWKLDDPQNVKVSFSTTVGQYRSRLITYFSTWESYCSEINIVTTFSGTENIYVYGDWSVDNGSFATVNVHTSNEKVITFWAGFAGATTAEQNEIIVHEMGHALGLAHCDSDDMSISVMRSKGFNNKARPLADDIEGISALYWNY